MSTKHNTKRIYHIFSFIFIASSSLLLTNVFWQWLQLWNTTTILNTDINDTINTDSSVNTDSSDGNWTIWDPIREWAYNIVNANNWVTEDKLLWIIDNEQEISEHSVALQETLDIIKNIINYALWLLSLVALIYLIAHWFMIVTAAWDDAKYKKWLAWIKYAIYAIAWIWLSWLIISFIFWIIIKITEPTPPITPTTTPTTTAQANLIQY